MSFSHLSSNVAIALSVSVAMLYYGPFFKYKWAFSLALELFPYLSAIALLGLILILLRTELRRERLRLGISALLVVLCWAPILNWVGMPTPGKGPDGIRVMSYNLWIDNPNIEGIEQSIRQENPDIVFLSEVTQPVMDELRSRLDYPYGYRTTGGNNGLLTRYPIIEAKTDDFGVKVKGRTFNLVATLDVNNDWVTVIGVHPPIPAIQSFFHIRNQQLDALAQRSRDINGKAIILGDFNATPWSPYFQRFERISQLSNAARGQWIWATWYFNQTLKTRYIKIPIDHIETRGFQPLKTWTGMTGGSDHKPVITVLKSALN